MKRVCSTAIRGFAASGGGAIAGSVPLAWQRRSCVSDLEMKRLQADVERLRERCDNLERQQHVNQLVKFFASVRRTNIDINQVVAKCRDPTYRQAIFCHRELPVIAAHMIKMIDELPSGLFAMKNVAKARGIVSTAFSVLTAQPVPTTPAEEKRFRDVLKTLIDDVEPVVQTMALGVLELRRTLTMHREALGDSPTIAGKLRSLHDVPEIQMSLDQFYLAFVQFKFLILQLLQTRGRQDTTSGSEDVVGIVDTSIDLQEVARSAAHNASMVCTEHYGDCPDIDIELVDQDDGRAYVSHLNDHLNYILVELLKNSLRATVDSHMKRNELGFIDCDDMPPIKVRICTAGSSDTATVVVSDQGGGIPRQDMAKIMSYTYTSAKSALSKSGDGDEEPTMLAGYGYGLPMSRIHARLFGGDIYVQSVEGYGTDAYLFLKKKGCSLRRKQQ